MFLAVEAEREVEVKIEASGRRIVKVVISAAKPRTIKMECHRPNLDPVYGNGTLTMSHGSKFAISSLIGLRRPPRRRSRRDPRRAGARRIGLLVVRGAGAALSCEGDGRGRAPPTLPSPASGGGFGRGASAGEQTYTLAGLADLIAAGVRMPDIVKMGGITGLVRCAALAQAHGVELVPHQTQPTIGHAANLHLAASQLHSTKPREWNDPSPRQHAVFENPPRPVDGRFELPSEPGLGLRLNEAGLAKRRVPLA